MATTVTYSGSLAINALFQALLTVEKTGSEQAKYSKSITFAAAGGTAPTLSGFLIGTGTAAAGDLLLAHATDPFQGMGDAAYSEGFTVAGTKLKLLILENLDSAINIAFSRGALNGLPVFDAAGDALTLTPGGILVYYNQAGTAALTTGSNDKLTVAPASGAPTFRLMAGYGP